MPCCTVSQARRQPDVGVDEDPGIPVGNGSCRLLR
jgi:hypothetical protein